MPEIIENKSIFSLHEVSASIQKTLNARYTTAFWVKAEMNKLNYYQHTGHCYPELVEKQNGKVIAQLRSHIWKDDFNRINRNFRQVLKEPLKDGIKVLLLARISFDPVYGLSLHVLDIDPGFTLGDLEKEKQATIDKLKEEDIFGKNKLLPLPLLPKRIAIISVESSKGYADFLEVIEKNQWSYKFFHFLFPSLLQGDKAIDSLIAQLRQIRKTKDSFDVVAIIRGGGGDIGLSCYNNYRLAREVALFPIPVITGIGHATNETVVEMISHTNAITPTKLAEFLIQKFHDFSFPLTEAERKVMEISRRIIEEEKRRFHSEIKLLRAVTGNILQRNRNEMKYFTRSLLKDTHGYLDQSKVDILQLKERLRAATALQWKTCLIELNNMGKNIENMSPLNVLKRGYSITLLDGKSVKTISELQPGSFITTIFPDGNAISKVDTINKTLNNE